MAATDMHSPGPAGARTADTAASRGRRSDDYRVARDEYAAIERLREGNWIAAHIRERRYELELTQQQVAERAGTSHSFISKLESGTHIPTIPVLARIFAALDERLLIGIERDTPDGEPERELAASRSSSRPDSDSQRWRPSPGRSQDPDRSLSFHGDVPRSQ